MSSIRTAQMVDVARRLVATQIDKAMKNNNAQAVIKIKYMSNKPRKTRKHKEAKIRRKIAKRWGLIEQGLKYRKAAAKEACKLSVLQMEDELFNGILLNLRGKNSEKSYNRQKRILRRIVEKRQAQQVHRKVGKTDNRFSNYLMIHCACTSMRKLRFYQGLS